MQPVHQIAHGATHHESQAKPQQVAGSWLAEVDRQQNGDADKGHEYQRKILPLKNSEGASGVVRVGKPEEPNIGKGSAVNQQLAHQVLGKLVQRQGNRRQLEDRQMPGKGRSGSELFAGLFAGLFTELLTGLFRGCSR